MPSHDVRIVIEHYKNGGFGVISSSGNFDAMGLISFDEINSSVYSIMLKELGLLKLEEK